MSAPPSCGPCPWRDHSVCLRPSDVSFCFNSSTIWSNASKREAQSRRYSSIQAVSSASRLRPSLQVRTRPTFCVVTSPACSRTPTCFFMPVRVMWNLSASSVIEASLFPSCSRTPRRVGSESAAKETSRRDVESYKPRRPGVIRKALSASELIVADLLHPVDALPVEGLRDCDVGHRGGGGRAVPVLLAGRNPDHVAG